MHRIWKLSLISLVIALPVGAVAIGWIGTNTNGLAPESMRDELAQGIVSQWSPYVEQTYGIDSTKWAERMAPTFEQADIANMERAASAVDFKSMNSALMAANAAPAVSGALPTAIGTPGSDLVYTPLTPCRIVDTRLAGGQIAGGQSRAFKAFTSTDFTSQGGDASNCGIPENASAVTVKITAAQPPVYGYFTVYPSNEARPLASSLNYFGNAHTSNESIFKLCRPGCLNQFSIYTSAISHVVVDVDGYFMEPVATALDCTVAQETGNLQLLGGLQPVDVACPSGYAATGGGCGGVLGVAISNSEPDVSNGQPVGWKCDLVGSLLSVLGYQVSATCCRVPGR